MDRAPPGAHLPLNIARREARGPFFQPLATSTTNRNPLDMRSLSFMVGIGAV